MFAIYWDIRYNRAMDKYEPVYTITPRILRLNEAIINTLAYVNIARHQILNVKLRRENRIKTIKSSLYIEQNTLTLEQVTDVINGKKVAGPEKEILEVKDAANAYDELLSCDPYSVDDLLKEHQLMIEHTINGAGKFRSHGVGVYAGDVVVHMAPPADQVPQLINQLFDWIKDSELPQIIKSCIFHYEFEFIHPFADGNGRTGRMWQTLLLSQYSQVFAFLPVETVIARRQQEYYESINKSTSENDCGIFVEFMLSALLESLEDMKINHVNYSIIAEAPAMRYLDGPQLALRLIKQNPNATYQSLADEMHCSTKTVQRNIQQLKSLGLVIRVGADKNGYWKALGEWDE